MLLDGCGCLGVGFNAGEVTCPVICNYVVLQQFYPCDLTVPRNSMCFGECYDHIGHYLADNYIPHRRIDS
jgi:hypothetical protein